MITGFENICVLKTYLIVMRPILDSAYKKTRKKTYEFYITNWYYSYKVGTVFAMYQIMISKRTSWDQTRHKANGERGA